MLLGEDIRFSRFDTGGRAGALQVDPTVVSAVQNAGPVDYRGVRVALRERGHWNAPPRIGVDHRRARADRPAAIGALRVLTDIGSTAPLQSGDGRGFALERIRRYEQGFRVHLEPGFRVGSILG